MPDSNGNTPNPRFTINQNRVAKNRLLLSRTLNGFRTEKVSNYAF
ncbi:hypothetical protein VDG1235_4270 [Verrucomicrobiia bacterium DG1235]|nr:hypothetical protein VDG1235_4270 [Verrucomicrobiae bacterium DG1235]